MHYIHCPLCAADNFRVLYPERLLQLENEFDYLTETPSHYQIVSCKDCGLSYSNPIYGDSEILKLYEKANIVNAIDASDLRAIRRNMRRYFDRLILASGVRSGMVCDIGCGTGELLQVATERGFVAHGVEPCAAAADRAAQLPEVAAIHKGGYRQELFADNHFDLITVIHVLDHVVNPLDLLKTVFSHLRPGGCMMAATHNVSSLLAKLSGESFIAYSVQHICYFDPASIRAMLEKAGFEVLSVRGSLTTYPLKHYIKNGIRSEKLRRICMGALEGLRVGDLNLTFPFGNIEVIGRKPAH